MNPKLFLAAVFLAPLPLRAEEPSPGPAGHVDRKPAEMQRARKAPGRAARPTWKEMSESDRNSITNFMQEHFPSMIVELDRLKESSPQKFERRMDRVAPETRRLMDVKQKDPKKAAVLIRERQVGLQLQQTARDYHSAANEEDKARFRKTVRELAAQEFDNRLERRKLEVHQLETKLAELKDQIAESETRRDSMLDRRTRELLERKAKEDDEEKDKPIERERSSDEEKHSD
jgi:hypothetical protein